MKTSNLTSDISLASLFAALLRLLVITAIHAQIWVANSGNGSGLSP